MKPVLNVFTCLSSKTSDPILTNEIRFKLQSHSILIISGRINLLVVTWTLKRFSASIVCNLFCSLLTPNQKTQKKASQIKWRYSISISDRRCLLDVEGLGPNGIKNRTNTITLDKIFFWIHLSAFSNTDNQQKPK